MKLFLPTFCQSSKTGKQETDQATDQLMVHGETYMKKNRTKRTERDKP